MLVVGLAGVYALADVHARGHRHPRHGPLAGHGRSRGRRRHHLGARQDRRRSSRACDSESRPGDTLARLVRVRFCPGTLARRTLPAILGIVFSVAFVGQDVKEELLPSDSRARPPTVDLAAIKERWTPSTSNTAMTRQGYSPELAATLAKDVQARSPDLHSVLDKQGYTSELAKSLARLTTNGGETNVIKIAQGDCEKRLDNHGYTTQRAPIDRQPCRGHRPPFLRSPLRHVPVRVRTRHGRTQRASRRRTRLRSRNPSRIRARSARQDGPPSVVSALVPCASDDSPCGCSSKATPARSRSATTPSRTSSTSSSPTTGGTQSLRL